MQIHCFRDTVSTLLAQFQIGADWYAIPAIQVVRILPLVSVKLVPGAPEGVAGALIYASKPVPVVDLSMLALGRPAARRLSTRIMLVRPFEAAGEGQLLGLIAERVTDMIQLDDERFVPAGVRSDGAKYLGPVAALDGRLLQRIEVRQLLPPPVFAALYDELE